MSPERAGLSRGSPSPSVESQGVDSSLGTAVLLTPSPRATSGSLILNIPAGPSGAFLPTQALLPGPSHDPSILGPATISILTEGTETLGCCAMEMTLRQALGTGQSPAQSSPQCLPGKRGTACLLQPVVCFLFLSLPSRKHCPGGAPLPGLGWVGQA